MSLYSDIAGAADGYYEGRGMRTRQDQAEANLTSTNQTNQRQAGLIDDEAYNRSRNRQMDFERDALDAQQARDAHSIPDTTKPTPIAPDDASAAAAPMAPGQMTPGQPQGGAPDADAAPAPTGLPPPKFVLAPGTDMKAARAKITGAASPDEQASTGAAFDANAQPGATTGGLPAQTAPATPAAPAQAPEPFKPSGIGDKFRLAAGQAYRKGDIKAYADHLEQAKDADFKDIFNHASKTADIDKNIAANNQTPDSPIVIHKISSGNKDSDSEYEIVTIRPNGSTNKVNASETQMRQIAGYKAALAAGVDPQRALQGIAGIDADLATAFHIKFQDQLAASKENNAAVQSEGMINAKGEATAMRAEVTLIKAAYYKGQEGGAKKEIPPEMIDAHNALITQYENSTDPKEQDQLRKKINASVNNMQTALGVPKMLAQDKPPPADMKVNPDGSVMKDGELYVPGKKPGEYIKASGIGPSALDKALARKAAGQSPDAAPAAPARGLPAPAPTAPAVDPMEVQLQRENHEMNNMPGGIPQRTSFSPEVTNYIAQRDSMRANAAAAQSAAARQAEFQRSQNQRRGL